MPDTLTPKLPTLRELTGLPASLADDDGNSVLPGLLLPSAENKASLWRLMETLFPIYRSLLGPGYKQSLDVIADWLPITTAEFPTGEQVLDWTIPQ